MKCVIKSSDRREFVMAIVDKYLMPVLDAKGRDYTDYVTEKYGGSSTANFSAISDLLGDTSFDRYRVWAVYFCKHLQSIFTWLRSRTMESESLDSRLLDAINYLLILWMMLTEDGLVKDPRTTTGM